MVIIMQQSRILDLFLALAANVDDPAINPYNALLLEIFTLLYRGVRPQDLVHDQQYVGPRTLDIDPNLTFMSSKHGKGFRGYWRKRRKIDGTRREVGPRGTVGLELQSLSNRYVCPGLLASVAYLMLRLGK